MKKAVPLDIKILPGSSAATDAGQRKRITGALQALHAAAGSKPMAAYVTESADISADVSEDGVPVRISGISAVVDGSVPAASLSPLLQDMGGRMLVYRLPESAARHTAEWQSAVTQSGIHAALHDTDHLMSAKYSLKTGDDAGWGTELTGAGAFAGVYAETQQTGARTLPSMKQYLVVHTAPSPRLTGELAEHIRSNPGMTAAQLAASPVMARLDSFADRNARAIGARVCELLDLPSETADDAQAARGAGEFHAPRQLLVGADLTRYGGVSTVDNRVAVHAGTVNMAACMGRSIAMPVDALHGVVVARAPRSLKNGAHISEALGNPYANTLSARGRALDTPIPHDALKSDMLSTLHWAGKSMNIHTDKVAASIGMRDVHAIANSEDARAKLGLVHSSVHTLVPLAVCVDA